MPSIHWSGPRKEYKHSLRNTHLQGLKDVLNVQLKQSVGLKRIPLVIHNELILFIQNGLHIRGDGNNPAKTIPKFNSMLTK